MNKYYKFEKSAAENIGLIKAIIYQFLNEQSEMIRLNLVINEFTFLTQQEIVNAILDLSEKGLISYNENKEQISIKKVLNKKRTLSPTYKKSQKIESDWVPSEDVIEVLSRSGIDLAFIDGLVKEFIIYWKDRPSALVSFNSKFVEYARIKWAQKNAESDTKTMPSIIKKDWKPSSDCFDIIKMTGISYEFAEKLLPEFILYWKNDGRAFISWDIKFLDFIKNKWSYKMDHQPSESPEKFDFYNPYEEDTQVKKTKSTVKLSDLGNKYKI